jgi:hypothetical protein
VTEGELCHWVSVNLCSACVDHASGAELIQYERARQIVVEGWSAEHDDKYRGFRLARAAWSYLAHVIDRMTPDDEPCFDWPWAKKWWKPSPDPVRNLVKAGALIAAEIDRLKRRAAAAAKKGKR